MKGGPDKKGLPPGVYLLKKTSIVKQLLRLKKKVLRYRVGYGDRDSEIWYGRKLVKGLLFVIDEKVLKG